MIRNKRIADRIDNGDIINEVFLKSVLHQGVRKSSKKVCAYGRVYENYSEASRALEKSDRYVGMCIRDGRHPDDIFVISDEFYKFVVDNKVDINIKEMYTLFGNK